MPIPMSPTRVSVTAAPLAAVSNESPTHYPYASTFATVQTKHSCSEVPADTQGRCSVPAD
eukprot:2738999-Amphidinium_carterae.1